MSISINNNKLLKTRQCRPSFKLNAYQTDLQIDYYIQNRTQTVILSTSLSTNRWAANPSERRYFQGFREFLNILARFASPASASFVFIFSAVSQTSFNYLCLITVTNTMQIHLQLLLSSYWPGGLRRSLRPLACWDCGFESRCGHVCLLWVVR
jgi:hypothetical protein